MNVTRETLSAAATVAMYLVRFIQLGSVAIAGFVVCYLVWMHNHHYCVWVGCGSPEIDPTSVPIGEVLFIIALILVVLEWSLFFSKFAYAAHTGKPAPGDSFKPFALACFVLFVYSIGFVAFASIPTVRATWPFCYNMWDITLYDPPEKFYCIVTQTGLNCGLITWVMAMLVALLNLAEYRKDASIGSIRLGDDNQLPTDAADLSIRDIAVDNSA